MKTSMLEYSKLILEKVSFDTKLFQKELRKSLQYLLESEIHELKAWLNAHFKSQAEPVLLALPPKGR